MKGSFKALLLVFISGTVLLSCSVQKKIVKEDNETLNNLMEHVAYLADDKLEGRRAGTEGEQLAMKYISNEFEKLKLEPKGTNGYYQAFPIYDGKQINTNSFLSINDHQLTLYNEFFPLVFSANLQMNALPAISLHEYAMPWFVDLEYVLNENKQNPHFDLLENIKTKTKEVIKKGGSALILYNTSAIDDKIAFDGKDKTAPFSIPVIYISKNAAKKYLSDKSATIDLNFKIDIGEKNRSGYNVMGFIDNGAPTTIILGAHFDHLGYGEDGNSMFRTGEKMIHNGADDNASGTAALIELSRGIKKSKNKNHNYLFIAFSGEELGLFGSKFFVENPTIDMTTVSCMINMDMVGRLNDSTHTMTVGGIGTSPTWGSVVNVNQQTPFKIKVDSSGTGPSDHATFYRKNIPVLFFFTGLHSDYHKPTDDFDKINYQGQRDIVRFIETVIDNLNNEKSKLEFTATREIQTSTTARFSVSLGIMPDYTYSGSGVFVEGVTEGRAAQKAGILVGDIILQLGDHAVSSMEAYMQTLSKFKKGDKTTVKFKRGTKTMEAAIEF